MSIEKVRKYFAARGMEDQIFEFDVSSATVELAAKALNCDGCLIAKTLSFLVHDDVILIVAPGDVKIDNHKYKTHFGVKAKMLPAAEAEQLIGHAVGGVCPFAVNEGVKVFLDKTSPQCLSLRRTFTTVLPVHFVFPNLVLRPKSIKISAISEVGKPLRNR